MKLNIFPSKLTNVSSQAQSVQVVEVKLNVFQLGQHLVNVNILSMISGISLESRKKRSLHKKGKKVIFQNNNK